MSVSLGKKSNKSNYFRLSFSRVIPAGILVIGALMLFACLDWKPLQHDEGVNAVFVEDIVANGFYKYDPANYHGPLHHYLMFFFHVIFGDEIWVLRLSAVLFCLAGIYLTLLFSRFIGAFSANTAALFTAVSPGMVFYSRYGIHESALYFFSLLGFYGVFHYLQVRNRDSIWLLGISVAGMVSMKETYVIIAGCFFLSFAALRFFELLQPSTVPLSRPDLRRTYNWKDIALVTAWCLFALTVIYSGFFMNWGGVFGPVDSLLEWVKIGALETSDQKGHWKSFLYWAQLFITYEWAACIGFLMVFPSLAPVPAWRRLILFYALINFLCYSAIPYKTPWCIMQIIWPFLFAAAGGFSEIAERSARLRWLMAAAVVVLAAANLGRSIQLNYFRYAEEAESYAHVQTYQEVLDIMKQIENMADRRPEIRHADTHILMKSYWPINWHVRNFSHVGYYAKHFPVDMDAGLILTDAKNKDYVELRLRNDYLMKKFRLNPAQEETFVYLHKKLYEDLLQQPYSVFSKAPAASVEGDSIQVTYFNGTNWEGESVKQGFAGSLNFGWAADSEKPLFAPYSAFYETQLFIPVSGDITFYLASDDGSALYLNGELVLDHLGDHPEEIKEHTRFFETGWYAMKVQHYDKGGVSSIRLWWKLPDRPQEWISSEFMKIAVSE